MRAAPQAIDRAAHALAATVKHVRGDHSRTDILVPRRFLDDADAVGHVEKVRREPVPQSVAAGVLGDAAAAHGFDPDVVVADAVLPASEATNRVGVL